MTTLGVGRTHQAYGHRNDEPYDETPPPAITADSLLNNFAYRQGLRRGVELSHMSYREYLRTPEWKSTRKLALEQANGACERCGWARWWDLEVHHIVYDHRGFEQLDELEVLCHRCHANHHETTR